MYGSGVSVFVPRHRVSHTYESSPLVLAVGCAEFACAPLLVWIHVPQSKMIQPNVSG